MEDAMILNKSSVDRGLAHALLYKTEMIDLREEKGKKSVLEPEPHDARSRVSARSLMHGRVHGDRNLLYFVFKLPVIFLLLN